MSDTEGTNAAFDGGGDELISPPPPVSEADVDSSPGSSNGGQGRIH